MSEATQTTAQPAPPQSLSASQAAQLYAERKAEANKAPQNDPVREAARTLGQRAAQARQERQAQTAPQSQEASEEAEQPVESTPESTPGDLTATESTETEQTTEAGEPAQEAQTIDLGDGVTMTVDEVRENILRQADYTRKTQEVAEKRKALEARESQQLAQLDQVIGVLQQRLGQPKSLKALLTEGKTADEALQFLAEQEEQQRAIGAAQELRNRQEAELISRALAERDQTLASDYNKEWADPAKRDKAYTDLTAFALKLGAKPEQLQRLTDPWMVKVLDKAAKFDAIEADKSKVVKAVAQKPPVIRPGTKVSAGAAQQSAIQNAHSKAKSSGSIADAAALLRATRAARG